MHIYSVAVNGNFSAEYRFKTYWKLMEKSAKNRRKFTQKSINELFKKNRTIIFNLNFTFNKNTNPITKIRFQNI